MVTKVVMCIDISSNILQYSLDLKKKVWYIVSQFSNDGTYYLSLEICINSKIIVKCTFSWKEGNYGFGDKF